MAFHQDMKMTELVCDQDMQDDDKSDTLIGRKRTFKNTKLRYSSGQRKSGNNVKEEDQLIVPESIQNCLFTANMTEEQKKVR